jgi:hypothetical protein
LLQNMLLRERNKTVTGPYDFDPLLGCIHEALE